MGKVRQQWELIFWISPISAKNYHKLFKFSRLKSNYIIFTVVRVRMYSHPELLVVYVGTNYLSSLCVYYIGCIIVPYLVYFDAD